MRVSIVMVLLGLGAQLCAQSTSFSALDYLTPKGLDAGSPAGSYALSGLDTINLYNGAVNFSVPLLQVGGRGEAAYTMRVQPSIGWDAIGADVTSGGTCSASSPCPTWGFSKSGAPDTGYRPANITLTYVGQGLGGIAAPGSPDPCPGTFYKGTLTRMTIALADGTSMKFRDAVAGGGGEGPTESQLSCSSEQNGAFNRGKVWVSVDGSGAKFVADHDIYDQNSPSSPVADNPAINCNPLSTCITYHPGGTLYFRDGRTYHFLNYTTVINSETLTENDVDWIQDRNGNRTIFLYPTPQSNPVPNPTGGPGCNLDASAQSNFCVVDPVGRMISVAIGRSWTGWSAAPCTSSCFGTYDEIDFPGTGGANRTIQVYRRPYWYDRAASLFGTSWPTYQTLFGGKACGSGGCPGQAQPSGPETPFDYQISEIVLPDGNTYQFNYDLYGDPTRVTLPTGGAFEFDWAEGPGVEACSGGGLCYPIVHASVNNNDDLLIAVYRRVAERREYANGGAGSPGWTRRTVYTPSELAANTTLKDPLSICTATPGYTPQAGYNYATEGWCTKVQQDEYDPAQGLLESQIHYYYGAASQGMFPVPGWYSMWLEGKEFRTDPATGRTQIQTWNEGPGLASTLNWWTSASAGTGPKPEIDARVTQSDLTIENNKLARTTFALDAYSNQTDQQIYDYGDTTGSQGTLIRHTHTNYQSGFDGIPSAPPDLSGPYPYVVSLPSLVTVSDGTNTKSQTSYSYDETAVTPAAGVINNVSVTQRGNATTVSRWRDTNGGAITNTWLKTITTFDTAGNALTVTNPRNGATTYTYGYCGVAFLSNVKDAAGHSTARVPDCNLLQPVSITDANQLITTLQYGNQGQDKLDRLSHVSQADGSNTDYTYSSDLKTVTTANDLDAGRRTTTSSTTDDLGRVVQTVDAAGVTTAHTLDALGRTRTQYNPGDTLNGTTYTYDVLSRPHSIAYADGSQETQTWTGDTVALADPAGSASQRQVDAAGRIVNVTEDPGTPPANVNAATTYTYDALDNLTGVTQSGLTSTCASGQSRCFVYNSLKALISANNPESGITTYVYDDDGNLSQRGAGAVTTSFEYDALDRVSLKSYAGVSTPAITWCYDGQVADTADGACKAGTAVNGVGRLTQVRNSVSITSYTAYDALGRVTSSTQNTGGTPYPFSYAYNAGGGLTKTVYPSGRTVMNGYDAAGRVCSVSGTATSGAAPGGSYPCVVSASSSLTAYANSVQYFAHGAMKSVARGDGLTETWGVNNRLQTTSVTAGGAFGMTLYYCAGKASTCMSNNGNVQTETLTTPGVDENFTYDALNRVASMQEGTNAQQWQYDHFGNRWVTGGTGLPQSSFLPSSAAGYNGQNQLTTMGAQYVNGKQTQIGSYTFGYDGENRLASSTNSGTTMYSYDGNGQRVMKHNSGGATTYVYDAFGALAAEYNTAGQSSSPCTTCYVTVDQLGSTRAVTNGSGAVVERHDYMPFGDELLGGVGGRTAGQGYLSSGQDLNVLFTGQYRDAENASSAMPSGLDYFGARYFSSAQGRFTSPDEPLYDQDPRNPQTWNLYAYGRNNPLVYIDPTGRAACKNGTDDQGQPCFDTTVYSPQENATGALKSIYNFFAGILNAISNAPSNPDAAEDPYHGGTYAGLYDPSVHPQLPTAAYNNEGQRKGAMAAGVIGVLTGPGEGRVITTLAEDAGAIHLEVKSAKGVYEVMANMRREGSTLILERTHIAAEGGVGAIGPGMRTELREAARQFGQQQGASEVIIVPGARLGGAGPVSPIHVQVQ